MVEIQWFARLEQQDAKKGRQQGRSERRPEAYLWGTLRI